MSVADRLTKLTTDITSAYTSIDNKGGTIPANKNTNNLSTAIDSIEVIEQQTAEGENLSLVNTKAMPYSDYVVEGKSVQEGEPSPSNPSEIHSVADDLNLINESLISADIYGLKWEYDSNNKKVKIYGTANNTYSAMTSRECNIPTGTYKFVPYGNTSLNYNLWLYNSSNQLIGNTKVNNPVTINETAVKFSVFVEGLTSGTTYNESMSFKIQKGTTATPYSPYNQGTVTIKQRGKNLLNVTATSRTYNNTLIVTVNNDKSITFNGMNSSNEPLYFRLAPNFDLQAGTYTLSNKNSNVGENSVIFYDDGGNFEPRSNIVTKTFSNIVTVKPYIKISIGATFDNFTIYPMIEQNLTATDYEPYQANDYTFQTEPLRSLPNGVKDTIEEDGIHRRVGRVVLDGSNDENWYYVSQSHSVFYIDNITQPYSNNEFTPYCNYFKGTTKSTGASSFAQKGNNLITFLQDANIKRIMITDDDYSNASNFKTWLSTHNIEVLYELAEEIIEPFTQQQATTYLDIIKTGSYEGTTNIYTDEDVKPTIKADYYKKK